MIRIGDFSKLSQVSIKTLRYYDEVGLFKPVDVDRFSGYRYYSAGQLPRLNRILALRDLGLSLEQFAQVLDEGVSPEQLRGMLRLKRAELQQHIAGEQARLARVEARLNTIELEDTMPDYDVVIKQIEPQLVAGVRETLSSYPEIGRLLEEVYSHLARHDMHGDHLAAGIWHDNEYKTSDIDGEGVVYLKQSIPEGGRVKVYELPSATVASVVHKGAYNRLNQAYEVIGRWIESNGEKGKMMMNDIQILSDDIPGTIGKVVELHATYYAQQWGFGLFFEAMVAKGLASFLSRFDESHDGFWIAVHDKQIVESITIDGSEAAVNGAHLRWFILDPEYQGMGIGKQLIGEAMRFCEEKNFRRVFLSTFAGLDAARHLYEQWGFKLLEENESDTWGVRVREQTFEWAR